MGAYRPVSFSFYTCSAVSITQFAFTLLGCYPHFTDAAGSQVWYLGTGLGGFGHRFCPPV